MSLPRVAFIQIKESNKFSCDYEDESSNRLLPMGSRAKCVYFCSQPVELVQLQVCANTHINYYAPSAIWEENLLWVSHVLIGHKWWLMMTGTILFLLCSIRQKRETLHDITEPQKVIVKLTTMS